MPKDHAVPLPEGREHLFIKGYLSDRLAAGIRPTYGYPASPLPDAGGRTMKVVSCWGLVAELQRKREAGQA